MTRQRLLQIFSDPTTLDSERIEIILAELETEERRRTAPTGLTHQPQMTLRDYFAGQALGIMNTAMDQGYWSPGENPNAEIAEAAYQVADAMLAAREKATT